MPSGFRSLINPFPRWDRSSKAPIADMDYIPGASARAPDFDCDDFAYAFYRWAWARGFNCWMLGIYWRRQSDGTRAGHAINIIEIERPALEVAHLHFACFEPQRNAVVASWRQFYVPGFRLHMRPRPTPQAQRELEVAYRATRNSLVLGETRGGAWGGRSPLLGAGEPSFTRCPELVKQFESKTGVRIRGWR